jgi:hypothetical protein
MPNILVILIMTLMASILIMTLMASILIMTLMASILIMTLMASILIMTLMASILIMPSGKNPANTNARNAPKKGGIHQKGIFLMSQSQGLLGKLFSGVLLHRVYF